MSLIGDCVQQGVAGDGLIGGAVTNQRSLNTLSEFVQIVTKSPRSPRAPAEFVATRHLLTHPEDTPAMVAHHCGLHIQSASRALKRLQGGGIWHDQELLAHARTLAVRPPRKAVHFQVPNPDQFLKALRKSKVRFWLSGEYAAALDGYDLVPERCLVYVRSPSMEGAIRAARDVMGKVTSGNQANVEIRLADAWLQLDPGSDLVERGQRLLDYEESRHVQILRSFDA